MAGHIFSLQSIWTRACVWVPVAPGDAQAPPPPSPSATSPEISGDPSERTLERLSFGPSPKPSSLPGSRGNFSLRRGEISPLPSLSLLPSSLGRWLLSLTRTRSPSIEKWRERTRRIHLIRWIITGDRGGSSFQGNSNFCSNNPFFNDEHHEI